MSDDVINPFSPGRRVPTCGREVEGNDFDRGADAFERYFLLSSFPLTPTPLSIQGDGCPLVGASEEKIQSATFACPRVLR